MISPARLVSLVPVRSMSRAVRFYTKVLGAEVHERGEGEMRDYWTSVRVGGAEVWLVVPQQREKRALAYHTFLVKNIKTTVKELERRGVKFPRATRMGPETRLDGPIAYEPFGASAFFKDSEGNLLMIWQNRPTA